MTRVELNKIANTPPSATPQRSGVQISTPVAVGAGFLVLLLFAGFIISSTLWVVGSQDTRKIEALSEDLASVRAQAATDAAATASTLAAVAEVTRSNVDLLTSSTGQNRARLSVVDPETGQLMVPADFDRIKHNGAEFDDAMKVSFEDAITVANKAELQVSEMEASYELPVCVSQLQELMDNVTIGFNIGSTEPLDKDFEGARIIASILQGCDPVMVAVEGHSDTTGQEQANMALSWIRAEAVVSRLRAEGFDIAAFEPLGFGSRKPIDVSNTPVADARNRRVQFHLAPRPGSDGAMFAKK